MQRGTKWCACIALCESAPNRVTQPLIVILYYTLSCTEIICYDVDTLQNLSRKLISPAAATGMAAGCAVEQLGVAAAELTHAGLALLHKFKSNASVGVREHCAIFD